VETREATIPRSYWLGQNYPNPFNPTTTIRFGLKKPSKVLLTLFDTLGQTVLILADKYYDSGIHELVLDGSELSSGVYYYEMSTDAFTAVKKCLILK
jgi:hypothetical protein